jgi:hypothetical protein
MPEAFQAKAILSETGGRMRGEGAEGEQEQL